MSRAPRGERALADTLADYGDEAQMTTPKPPAAKVGIKVMTARIDPRMAEQMLRRNTHNRPMRESTVQQYAVDIRNGDWQLNGEAIKISIDGEILDGQHRLTAVMEADTSIETVLITGLPAETQETMDQGRSRSFSDALKLRGEQYYSTLGGAARMVCLYERDGVPYLSSHNPSPSLKEQSRTLARNPDIRDSVQFAVGPLRRPWLSTVSVSALHYLFSSANVADGEDFFVKVLTGVGLQATDAPYVLRERLIREHHEGYVNSKIKLAFVVRAWNAYRTGEPLRRLVFSPGGSSPDRFPEIDGLAVATKPEGAFRK